MSLKHLLIYRIYFIWLLLFSTSWCTAIAGNEPCTATPLQLNLESGLTIDNSFNSNSLVEAPPLGDYLGPDTWLSFTFPSSGLVYLLLDEGTMVDPAIAIYSGPCDDIKLIYNILDNNCIDDPSPQLEIDDLTPGDDYYIRVWPQAGSNDGTFTVSLLEYIPDLPHFTTFGDATVNGECIELTQETNSQRGCAWFQIPIDFSMPFTHSMTANFGTKNSSGADGITLVYQINGPDYCGGSGQGIGAEGMPNSAIFEFDTWSNTNLFDPVDDHASFNINGDMNHLNSIDGPVLLNNIEDGQDHEILFSWDPTGNMYTLTFDGVLLFNGSFDIINNCFGGSTTAFWGYTSSTGGSNNLHTICPQVEFYEPSTVEHNDIMICEGEAYNNNTESGFYTEYSNGPNGCIHVIHTTLTVAPTPDILYLDKTVCEGDVFLLEGVTYDTPGNYEINLYTEHGCDSLINLELYNYELALDITTDTITCAKPIVTLGSILTTNLPFNNTSYIWTENNNVSSDSILSTTEGGLINLDIQVNFDDAICNISSTTEIYIDTMQPPIPSLEDIIIDCTLIDSVNILSVNLDTTNFINNWIFGDSLIGTTDTVIIGNEGIYYSTIIDTTNGCFSIDSAIVSFAQDIPVIVLGSDQLDCATQQVIPEVNISTPVSELNWVKENEIFSEQQYPIITEPGQYIINVSTESGCKSSASIEITLDTLMPIADLSDGQIECDEDFENLIATYNPLYVVTLEGPNGQIPIDTTFQVETSGEYILTVFNLENNCISSDTTVVIDLGDSPIIITDSIPYLNCQNNTGQIQVSISEGANYQWFHEGTLFSNAEDPLVSETGEYHLLATNQFGCASFDTIFIEENFIVPSVDLLGDTLDCINESISLYANIYDGIFNQWSGPEGENNVDSILEITLPGTYFFEAFNNDSKCISYDSIEILFIGDYPDFIYTPDSLDCSNQSLELGLSIISNYNNITWSGPNDFISNEINPIINDPGTYAIQLEGSGGCIVDTAFIITQNITPPEIILTFDSITCLNEFATISGSPNVPGTFELTGPNGLLSDDLLTTTSQSGQYIFEYVGLNGCVVSDSFDILSFTEPPTASLGAIDTLTCNNLSTTLTASGNPNITFSWFGENGLLEIGENLDVNTPGNYSLQISNEFGCTNTYEVNVIGITNEPLIAISGDDLTCDKELVDLYFESDHANLDIFWSGPGIINPNLINQTISNPGLYTLQAINEFGCSTADSIEILSFTESPQIISVLGDTVLIEVGNLSPQIIIDVISSSQYSVQWLESDGLSCDDCLEPFILDNSKDFFRLEVINEYGCQDEYIIHLVYEKEIIVTIPNIFSPENGDGINDFFTLYGNENVALITNMSIYDRWGNKINYQENFVPNDPTIGWDGKHKGLRVESGVYVYVINILTTEGKEQSFIGDITVYN